jgi:type II secretory pathway component PulF
MKMMLPVTAGVLTIFAALRRKPEPFTKSEITAIAWAMTLGGLLVGICSLYMLDFFRDRVKKFQPLIPEVDRTRSTPDTSITDVALNFVMACGLVTIAIVAGTAGQIGLALLGSLILVSNRFEESAQRRRVANICREVAEAIRVGARIDEFFDVLSKEYKGNRWLPNPLKNVGVSLRDGEKLSVALSKTLLFDSSTLAVISASEITGGRALSEALDYLGRDLLNRETVRQSRISILTYPLVVWAATLVLSYFIANNAFLGLFYDVPRSIGLRPVPATFSPAVISNFLLSPSGFILLGLILVGCSYSPVVNRVARRTEAMLPFLGRRLRHRCLALCARTISTLTASNVPFATACRRVDNRDLAGPYASAFRRVAEATERGEALTSALRNSGLPDSFVWLAVAGAAGGTFSQALAVAAEWHESRAERLDRILVAALPCITIPLTGLIVGLMYGSVFWILTAIRETLMRDGGLLH